MSEKPKEKKLKNVPTISTSINDVEFKKQLFRDNRKEKISEKYNTRSNLSNDNHFNNNPKKFNNCNIENDKPLKNNISIMNISNSSDNNIQDFNRNVFNKSENEENDRVYEDNKERSYMKDNGDINYLLSSNNYNSNDNMGDPNSYNDYINIRENEQYNYNNRDKNYTSQIKESNLNLSFEEYKNQKSLMTPKDQQKTFNHYDNNNNYSEEKITYNNSYHQGKTDGENDFRKIYLNYNHLNTPGVYETTISYVNSEEDIERRSKYRLIDKTKMNNSSINLNLKHKKVNRSLPNIDLNHLNNNRNENLNFVDYNLVNRTIKIPKRYMNCINNKESFKKFKQITSEEEESRHRIWHLLQKFYSFVEESKIDPILDTFKNNEILKEFFVQRILELIANIFDSEKEMYIQKLLIDRKEYESNLKDTQKTYEELNSKLNILEDNLRLSKIKDEENTKSFIQREADLVKSLNEKESKIKSLSNQLDYQEKEFNDLCNRFADMNKDFNNFKSIQEKIIIENNNLKTKIRNLEDDTDSSHKRYNELDQINRKYEEENATLTKQLNQFREDYDIIKSENERIKMDINKLIEENFTLKIKVEDKSKFIDELMEKYEKGKKEKDGEITNYETELERLNKKIIIMEETIKNTYKVKNAALKNKLKEKVDLLGKITQDFENYKNEKEKLITKMLNNHQVILNEKNNIIEELMKRK